MVTQPRWPPRRVLYLLITLGLTAVAGLGLYHVIKNGSCQSGGYQVTTLKPCKSDEMLWLMALILGGMGAIVGWLVVFISGPSTNAVTVSATGARVPDQGSVFGVPATPQAGGHSHVDELTKLAELHRSGALTDAEFEAEKARILSSS
jgi:Short C-terminal domain